MKYCSQGNNDPNGNVQSCGAGFIPLNNDGSAGTDTAEMVWDYANDQAQFHENFMGAWQKLMTVPANDNEALTDFQYGLRCVTDVEGSTRPRCVGDVYQQGCVGFTVPQEC